MAAPKCRCRGVSRPRWIEESPPSARFSRDCRRGRRAASVHSPRTVSRPSTVSPRSVKKAMVASRSRTAIATFSSLIGMPRPYRAAGSWSGRHRDLGSRPPDRRRPCRRMSNVEASSLHSVALRSFYGLNDLQVTPESLRCVPRVRERRLAVGVGNAGSGGKGEKRPRASAVTSR